MEVRIRPRGHEEWIPVEVECSDEDTDRVVGNRAIHKADWGGCGKIKVRGITYGYEFGEVRPLRHC